MILHVWRLWEIHLSQNALLAHLVELTLNLKFKWLEMLSNSPWSKFLMEVTDASRDAGSWRLGGKVFEKKGGS